ncbi:unnamed protein product, partial [Prorocentrum cordatum]
MQLGPPPVILGGVPLACGRGLGADGRAPRRADGAAGAPLPDPPEGLPVGEGHRRGARTLQAGGAQAARPGRQQGGRLRGPGPGAWVAVGGRGRPQGRSAAEEGGSPASPRGPGRQGAEGLPRQSLREQAGARGPPGGEVTAGGYREAGAEISSTIRFFFPGAGEAVLG